MGKIIVQQLITLDGVIEDPGGETDFEHGGWQIPFVDEDQLRWATARVQDADALLLGRRTYEGFVAAWPGRSGMLGLADRMNAIPKHVVSSTLTEPTWNAAVIGIDDVAAQRDATEGDLAVVGSTSLAKHLVRADLVDGYWLLMAPVVLGAGERLFDGGPPRHALTLTDVQRSGTGMTFLTYERDRG